MGDSELQVFSDRLKEFRNKLNMTQAAFAEGIGITASALSAYENNLKNPSIGVVKKIAEKYHVSIDWLCGLSQSQAQQGKQEIKTYSDVIRVLLSLRNTKNLNIDITTIDWHGVENYFDAIVIHDQNLKTFLREWHDVLALKTSGKSFNDKLYNIWLQDALQQYDFEIPPQPEFLDLLDEKLPELPF